MAPVADAVWLICDIQTPGVCVGWVKGAAVDAPGQAPTGHPNQRRKKLILISELAPGVLAADIEISSLAGVPHKVTCRACAVHALKDTPAHQRAALPPGEVWALPPEKERDHCGVCGKRAVVPLPLSLLAKMTDGTTHVCHPSIGGCNTGYEPNDLTIVPPPNAPSSGTVQ